MSTRCTIHFHGHDDQLEAIVYRHMDGYPDTENGVLADLERFFDDLEEQTGSASDDGASLAAKFVVWQSEKNRKGIDYSHPDTKAWLDWHRQNGQLARAGKSHGEIRQELGPEPEPSENTAPPLNFQSLAVMMQDPGDIQYRYHVREVPIGERLYGERRRPTVDFEKRCLYTDTWSKPGRKVVGLPR